MANIKSFNKVILAGTVGKLYEARKTRNDKNQIAFSMVTNEKFGDGKERKDWHTIFCYGKTAEFVEERVGVGTVLIVEGKLRQITWTDDEGVKKWDKRVECESLSILVWKKPEAEAEESEDEGRGFGDDEEDGEPKEEGEEEATF
jgi:single-strand DNA-binding protein